jgi:hypothetical protein
MGREKIFFASFASLREILFFSRKDAKIAKNKTSFAQAVSWLEVSENEISNEIVGVAVREPTLLAHLIHNELDRFLNSLQSLLSGFSPRVGSFQRRAVGGKSYAAVLEPVFLDDDFEHVAFHIPDPRPDGRG